MGTLKAGLKARETYLDKSKPRTENYTEVASEQGQESPWKGGAVEGGGLGEAGAGGGRGQHGKLAPGGKAASGG